MLETRPRIRLDRLAAAGLLSALAFSGASCSAVPAPNPGSAVPAPTAPATAEAPTFCEPLNIDLNAQVVDTMITQQSWLADLPEPELRGQIYGIQVQSPEEDTVDQQGFPTSESSAIAGYFLEEYATDNTAIPVQVVQAPSVAEGAVMLSVYDGPACHEYLVERGVIEDTAPQTA